MQINHEKYVNLSIQWNRWLMKTVCLWPKSVDASRFERIYRFVVRAVIYTLIVGLLIPSSTYGMLDVEAAYDKLKVFGPVSFFIMAMSKYYTLSRHGKDIRECVERIEWDWKNVRHVQDRDVMITNAKFGRHLMLVCNIFVYGSFVFYCIFMPISMGLVVDESENLTYIPPPFPFSKYILDPRRSPTNEIVNTLQIVTSIINHTITAAACNLAAAFAVHANGQMEILMCWLEHLINGREDMNKSVDNRITEIVKQHMRVMQFLTVTEKALQGVSFVELLGCSTNMCMLSYYMIKEWNIGGIAVRLPYTMLILTFTFNIFIFCYIGELVANQWKMIGEISYLSDWHELPGKRKLSFILIIAISNTSKKLTAGNILELSLSSFSDIVKTTFGFFNMLVSMT